MPSRNNAFSLVTEKRLVCLNNANLSWYRRHLGELEYSRDSMRASADINRLLAKQTDWGTGKRLEFLARRRENLTTACRMRRAIRELKTQFPELA